jgi:hypothetical protein
MVKGACWLRLRRQEARPRLALGWVKSSAQILTPTLQTGLAGLQGPSPMFPALGQLRGFGSQSSVSLSFSLSGTPPGRIVSRLSGGVIGGRCIGLNEKAK